MDENQLTFWTNYQRAMQWIREERSVEDNVQLSKENDEKKTMEVDSDPDIDEDLLEFYRQTKNHRASRKTQRAEEKSRSDQVELIPGEQMRPNLQTISTLPPVNRSKQRQIELDWLYGSSNVSSILLRETALQMDFDKMFDKKRADYFPSLPNRLTLEPQQMGQITKRINQIKIVHAK